MFERIMAEISKIKNKLAYAGKFIGHVIDNDDPENKARIKVKIDKMFNNFESDWVIPCTMYAGNNYGTVIIPEIGDTVIIEFLNFNPNNPVYVGQYWGADTDKQNQTIPEESSTVGKIIKSKSGNYLLLDDSKDVEKIVIKHKSGKQILISNDEILVTDEEGTNLINIKDEGVNITTGSTDIAVQDGNINITNSSGDTNVETVNLNINGNVVLGNMLLPPVGFCALPACLFTGAPHTSNTYTKV